MNDEMIDLCDFLENVARPGGMYLFKKHPDSSRGFVQAINFIKGYNGDQVHFYSDWADESDYIYAEDHKGFNNSKAFVLVDYIDDTLKFEEDVNKLVYDE